MRAAGGRGAEDSEAEASPPLTTPSVRHVPEVSPPKVWPPSINLADRLAQAVKARFFCDAHVLLQRPRDRQRRHLAHYGAGRRDVRPCVEINAVTGTTSRRWRGASKI